MLGYKISLKTFKKLKYVYNSKDLEATQIPIDDKLDWENVAHIHHGILCSNQKR